MPRPSADRAGWTGVEPSDRKLLYFCFGMAHGAGTAPLAATLWSTPRLSASSLHVRVDAAASNGVCILEIFNARKGVEELARPTSAEIGQLIGPTHLFCDTA